MTAEIELERAMRTVIAAINDPPLEGFDGGRVQGLIDAALGGERRLMVDDGGGVHLPTGQRLFAIRRTPSGEWIADRQNPWAERSDASIPAA